MRIETDDRGNIIIEEVYNGFTLKTNAGETMGICMRDSGFEFNYQGKMYAAQNGFVRKMESNEIVTIENEIPTAPYKE